MYFQVIVIAVAIDVEKKEFLMAVRTPPRKRAQIRVMTEVEVGGIVKTG